ncbi:MAG: hypothetical protein AAGA59_16550 [Actinomycetota bacterium]
MARVVGFLAVVVMALGVGSWSVSAFAAEGAPVTRALAVADRDAVQASAAYAIGLDGELAAAVDTDTDIDTDTDLDEPPEELGYTEPHPNLVHFQQLDLDRWASGVYSVGESLDPLIAAVDSDVEPRDDELDIERRLDGEVFTRFDIGSRQGEILPGLYTTDFDASDCGYELWHVERTSREAAVIGEEYLATGRLLVDINGIEPDWFVSSNGCGDWFQWQPRPEPRAPALNGDYWVGDLAFGQWLVPTGCIWEKAVTFRGGLLRDVVESGQGPDVIEMFDEPLGLRLRNCRTPMTFVSSFGPLRSSD